MELTDYRTLGRSGLRVSPVALGTMTFGSDWGWGADEAESRRLFDHYADRGGNFIDTANFYTNGSSERLLGRFVADRRDRFVIATKYSLNLEPGDPNGGGNHRKSLVRAVEASLRRLGTDYLDLLYLHIWDELTPVEEVMRGFDDLVRAGKVLYPAISDTPAWQVARMQTLADLRGWSPLIALQIEYSLIQRTVERDLVPMADALDLAILAWSPLGMGVLTGKYDQRAVEAGPPATLGVTGTRESAARSHDKITASGLEIAAVVGAVAREQGITAAQVALGWLLQRPGPGVIPIVGARTTAQLEENLGALAVTLDRATLARLDQASAVPLGFPHDFLRLAVPRNNILGGTRVERRRAHA